MMLTTKEAQRPPTITIANGRCESDPRLASPLPRRNARSPRMKLEWQLFARNMMIRMPFLGQPAKNSGRAAGKIVNSNPQRSLFQCSRLYFRKRQHLLRLEAVRMVQLDDNDVGDRQHLVQPLQRVVGNHLPVIDDHDAVAEALRLFHIVRGVDKGFAPLLQRLEVFKDGVAALRIDTDRRLIEQKN